MILIEKSTCPHGTESRDDLDFHWLEPYRPGEFAVLPPELAPEVTACAGYCDLTLADYTYTTEEPREVTTQQPQETTDPETGEPVIELVDVVTVELETVTHTTPQGLVTAITAHEVPPGPEPDPDYITEAEAIALLFGGSVNA